jgi:vancomycin permeability regulator SanA
VSFVKKTQVLIGVALSFALAVLGLVGATTPVMAAPNKPVADLPAVIKARILYYEQTGSIAGRDQAVAELAALSPFVGDRWREFVNAWEAIDISTKAPAIPQSGHAFVVLGSALNSDGTISAKLKRRLKVVLPLLKENPASICIVSGGKTKKGQIESQVGKDWLISQGISESQIITETKSASTVGNALYSMAIIRDQHFTSYTLISDYSHLKRATVLFNAAQLALETNTGKPLGVVAAGNVAYNDKTSSDSQATIAGNVTTLMGLPAVKKASDGSLVVRFADGTLTTLSGGLINMDLISASVAVKNATWSGKAIKPAVTVKADGKILKAATDYTLAYRSNTAIGTGEVTITGKGKYVGTTRATFTIAPKNTKVKSLKVGKKKITVKWSKVSAKQKVTNYLVYYRVNKKEKWKALKVAASKSAVTIKKLKKSAKYQVKIITQKKVSGQIFSSAASATKTSKKVK